MVERGITDEDVRATLTQGHDIESYPDDIPYPSRLVLGWRGARPIHIVVAENANDNETIVVTVYEPAPDRWESGFAGRKV
jgi:hypothetical protein